MSDFSQLLSCHIHSKDIKTYALAQYCGLDRSNMYKIINGKRKPSSRELVLKICKFMQLSHAEQKEMEQAYEITLIGHDTYSRRKAVVDFFNNFRWSKLNLPVLSELNTEILFEIRKKCWYFFKRVLGYIKRKDAQFFSKHKN